MKMLVTMAGLVLAAIALAAQAPKEPEAPLVLQNRTVLVFRAPFHGVPPALRAARARMVIQDALAQGGELAVAVKPYLEEQLVTLDDKVAFAVTDGDGDPAREERPAELARQAALRLRQIIAETREARNLDLRLRALAATAGATLLFLVLLRLLNRGRERLARVLADRAALGAEALRIGGAQLLEGRHVLPALRRLLQAGHGLVVLVLAYEWVSFGLSRFPYTRPWGESLNANLLGLGQRLLAGMVGALPGLVFAVAIFAVARLLVGFVHGLLQRLAEGEAPPRWLAPQTLSTTRHLAAIVIWLFALAIAYPYLPGSQTEAFKGLSVLLGLMLSLGSSSLVGQGAAGLILTYTQTLKPGEYVHLGEFEGTVLGIGTFTTRIRTGAGVELTLPNAMITATVARNYSRNAQGGCIVDTTVTIGYDAPWRQVEAMLTEAARRTPGILAEPAPRVFHTALSDFYPEYRLVAQARPADGVPRAEVLSLLHANIQDVFNTHGVQIMSPHYVGDPAQAKMVPPAHWHGLPPAP